MAVKPRRAASPFGRRRVDDAEPARPDFAHFERADRNTAIVETEDPVDPAEAVLGEQSETAVVERSMRDMRERMQWLGWSARQES